MSEQSIQRARAGARSRTSPHHGSAHHGSPHHGSADHKLTASNASHPTAADARGRRSRPGDIGREFIRTFEAAEREILAARRPRRPGADVRHGHQRASHHEPPRNHQ